MNKAKSLRISLLKYFISFIVIIFLILWLFEIVFFKSYYDAKRFSEMASVAKELKKIDENKFIQYLNSVYSEKKLNIMLFNDQGVIIYPHYLSHLIIDVNEVKEILHRKNVDEIIEKRSNKDADYIIYLSKYPKLLEGNTIYIQMYDVYKKDGLISIILREQLIYITLIALFLAIVLSNYMAKHISEPIRNISAKAEQIGSGNKDLIFNENRYLEAQELSKALNNANKELMKTNLLRDNIIANVSHDLKTPLTVIRSYAEMIKDISGENKESRDRDLDVIISESERLTNLVNEILSISVSNNKNSGLNISSIDLYAISRDVIKNLNIINSDNRIVIDKVGSCICLGDKNKITEVIYNLIINALNYSYDESEVTVRITEEKGTVLYEVIDKGIGIKKDEIGKIWDMYYQASDNHKEGKYGSGLGLFIVKEILSAHNVNFGVKSIYNKGSTFFFRLKKE